MFNLTQTKSKSFKKFLDENGIEMDIQENYNYPKQGQITLVTLHFNEDHLIYNPSLTENDFLSYRFKEEEHKLFFLSNYQVENLEDLPYMIDSIDVFKDLIKYMSKEAQ